MYFTRSVIMTLLQVEILDKFEDIFVSLLLNHLSTTAWKVPVFGVILVRIFPHLDWIQRNTRCECGKIRTRIALNTDTFYTVWCFKNTLGFLNHWETMENIESSRKNLFCRQKVIIFRIMRKPETAVPRTDVL